MEFLQLNYFRHAAKTENFSHTAKHFMVPPSSVSLTIKKLETEIGAKLFDRYGNTVKLNEKGRIFLKSVNNIFSELDTAKSNINELTGVPTGTIRMLIMTNRRSITKIISEFRNKYPDVSFVLDLSKNSKYIDYDIVVSDTIISEKDFYSKTFITEEIRLAVPKSHPLASRNRVDMHTLSGEKFISFSPNHSLRDITDVLSSQAGFSPNIVIECNDPFYICEYVKMGMGVSVVPMHSWKNSLDNSVSLLKINDGFYRCSKVYINFNASYSAKFFFQFIKPIDKA